MRRAWIVAAVAALSACGLFRWSGQPTGEKRPVSAQPAVHAVESAPPIGKGMPLEKKAPEPLKLGPESTGTPKVAPAQP